VRRGNGDGGGDFVPVESKRNAGEHISEQLKEEIKTKYNIKTNIIGPAVCSMAMHLDFTERARDIHKLTKGHEGGNHSRVDTKVCMNAEPVKFTEGFMYGGQGKNRPVSEIELCTKKQSSHFAGSDNHDTKDTTSGTAAETRLTSQTGLSQPRIAATREAITGANKNKMRAENQKR
jgi:hypothetical protein